MISFTVFLERFEHLKGLLLKMHKLMLVGVLIIAFLKKLLSGIEVAFQNSVLESTAKKPPKFCV